MMVTAFSQLVDMDENYENSLAYLSLYLEDFSRLRYVSVFFCYNEIPEGEYSIKTGCLLSSQFGRKKHGCPLGDSIAASYHGMWYQGANTCKRKYSHETERQGTEKARSVFCNSLILQELIQEFLKSCLSSF